MIVANIVGNPKKENNNSKAQPCATSHITHMTEEQKRILIAEFCGYTNIVRENRGEFGGLRGDKPDGSNRIVIPSFCRDLNAIHEAEKQIEGDVMWTAYVHNVADFAGFSYDDSMTHEEAEEEYMWYICHADAEAKSNALVKTLEQFPLPTEEEIRKAKEDLEEWFGDLREDNL